MPMQRRTLLAGQRTSTLVLLAAVFVVTAALLGTLAEEGAFGPPVATPTALPGDREWATEDALIHTAAATSLAAGKAANKSDEDAQLGKLNDYCMVADGLPAPLSDAAKAHAQYVQDTCASFDLPSP
jgi:hypothetical protein